jgi:hypothetical protein
MVKGERHASAVSPAPNPTIQGAGSTTHCVVA